MRRHQPIKFAVFFVLIALTACDNKGPRKPHFPTFDARQPFPELVALDAKDPAKRTTKRNSSFERAISKELQAGGEEGSSVSAESQNIQTISLANVFVADIPLKFNEWQVSIDGSSTIITHQKPGVPADAMIYIEGFSPAVESFPSYEVARFQMVVDPGLSPNAIYPPLLSLGASWLSNKAGVPPIQTIRALQQATTRTMGKGFGYRSTEKTFSGWKWMGNNDADIKLRLGRTSGIWGGQETNTVIPRAMLETLKKQAPELGRILQNLPKPQASRVRSSRPAWMILGSAVKKDTLGIHIAVVCQRQPVCPVAEELSQFFATIRPRAATQTLAAPTSNDPKAFLEKMGINLLDSKNIVSAPQMVRILQQAMMKNLREKQLKKTNGKTPSSIPKIPTIPSIPKMPEMPSIPSN